MSTIVRKIDEYLQHHKTNIAALEKAAGVKPLVFRNILLGRTKNPSIATVHTLAKILGCPIEDLLDDSLQTLDRTPMIESEIKVPTSEMLNYALLKSCLAAVVDALVEVNSDAALDKILSYVEELYRFSSKKKLTTPDLEFLDWLIHNY